MCYLKRTPARLSATDLMDKCNLHTILRLPTGIFYAQGVKTNVLFFTRGETDKGNTRQVWIYDLRTNMPSFGKRTPLTRQHFAEFEQVYGMDKNGTSLRKDHGRRRAVFGVSAEKRLPHVGIILISAGSKMTASAMLMICLSRKRLRLRLWRSCGQR